MNVVPAWISDYQRSWIGPDLLAGVVVWSVVTPQAVAYAQIAGLPPQAGLMAAPGALVAYALLGTSRTLVVSATTATSAVSAAAVGAIAGGDAARFAALSAMLALVTATTLVVGGLLRLGRMTDLVSKPVMTGFLFGLGLVVALAQLPALLGIDAPDGGFFHNIAAIARSLDSVNPWTLAMGTSSVALLILLAKLAPALPGTLIVLVLSIIVSAILGLADHGVDVVGRLPAALPHPAWPGVDMADAMALVPAALGMMVVSAEAVGVSRAIASADGYAVDPNRDLVALGASNLLAGLSQGFVQSGGASQTMASEKAGGKTQLASLVAAALILLTGAFLAPLFADLPQATLAAIVIVAIAGFYRVDDLTRFARIRTSALWLSLLALAGVLAFGVLPGLLIAAGVSLVLVIQRLSRPAVGVLARDPDTGAWGRADRHHGWHHVDGIIVARVDGPLFYANAESVKDHVLAAVRTAHPKPHALVIDMGGSADLDVSTLDILRDLITALDDEGIELRLAEVHVPVRELLERSGLAEHVRIASTIDTAAAPDLLS